MSASPEIDVPVPEPRPNTIARWLGVVVVLCLLAGAVGAGELVSSPQQPTYPTIDRWFPLDVGSTWVYESRTPGAQPTTKVTQVIGRGTLGAVPGAPTAEIVETRGYDGDSTHTFAYYVRSSDAVTLPLSRDGGAQNDADPDYLVLKLPLDVGASWDYAGEVYGLAITASTTRVDRIEDMTIAGTHAEGCAVTVTEFTVRFDADYPATNTVWTCPGIGTTRSTTVSEGLGINATDELVAFSLPEGSSAVDEVAATDLSRTTGSEAPGEGVGMDVGRSNSIASTPDFSRVAWDDLRHVNPAGPPVGNDHVMLTADEDGTVSAFDHRTGQVSWRIDLTGRALFSPVIAGGVAVVEDAAKTVIGLDIATGRTLWMRSFPDVGSAPPLLAAGRAVVPLHDGTVRALNLADGSDAWRVDMGSIVVTPPALSGEIAIVADTGGAIRAIRVADGSEAWHGSTALRSDGGPAVRDGLLVVADQQSQVSGINAATGDMRWEASLPSFVSTPVAIGPDEVIVHLDSGAVYSLDAGTGSTRWKTDIGGAQNAPVVAGDQVLILTDDSRLHVLDRMTGAALQVVDLPVPGDRALSDTEIDLASFAGLLVVEVDAEEPVSNPYIAYPLVGAETASGALAPGVVIDANAREVFTQVSVAGPRAEPRALDAGQVVFPDYSSVVWSMPFDQSKPLTQLAAGSSVPWTVPAGDLVLMQDQETLKAVPVAGGEPRWSFPMGRPFPEVMPAVADGRVFVPIEAGVTALDLQTGMPLWHGDSPGIGRYTPVVVGDVVVTAIGGLRGWDVATGQLRWQIDGVEGFSPLAADHGVVFASVASLTGSFLVAVNAGSGTELWRVPFNGPVFIGPAATASTTVGIESDGTVRAFDAATGNERWQFGLRTYPSGAPQILKDGVVAVAEEGLRELIEDRDYRVTFLDVETGRFLGSYEPAGSAAPLPAFSQAADRLMVYDSGYLLQLLAHR